MLEVAGRPLIDHLAERALRVQPDEIRVVTRPEKTDLVEHADARGWHVVLGHPRHVAASLLLGIEGLAGDTAVLAGFPDTLITAADAATRTIEPLLAPPSGPEPSGAPDVVLGLFHNAEPWRGDVVELSPTGKVLSVVPKPATPTSDLVWGLLAGRVTALRGLTSVDEPGLLWDRYARAGRVAGVLIDGDYLDLGTPASLAAARADSTRP